MAAKDRARPCGHHRPRGKEGTQPQSCLMRVEHGNPVGVRHAGWGGGKPEVTKAQVPGGNRMPKKPMPVAERRQQRERGRSALRWSVRITGRIPGRVPGRESAPTWAGEPLTNGLPKQLEPKDKLGADMVNGPEGLAPETGLDTVDWDWVDWSDCEREVRLLRQQIFKATREGDPPGACFLPTRASRPTRPETSVGQPACPRGLLEPYAATSGTYGCMSHARLCRRPAAGYRFSLAALRFDGSGVPHNYSASRNARSWSGGRYLLGVAPSGAVRAIARSLRAGSA